MTLYDTPASDGQSKVHIQSNQHVNDEYIRDQMPFFYLEVRKLSQDSIGLESSDVSKGRATRSSSKKNVEEVKSTLKQKTTAFPVGKKVKSKCDVCGYKNKNVKLLNDHMKEHDDRFDKMRKLTDLDSSVEEMDQEEQVEEESSSGEPVEPASDEQERVEKVEEDDIVQSVATESAKNDERAIDQINPEMITNQSSSAEIQKLKEELIKIGETNQRLSERNKKLEKENREHKAIVKEKDEVGIAYVMKLTELEETNSVLLTKLQVLQDISVTDVQLNEKYEKMRTENAELKSRMEELQKDNDETDVVDITELVKNKFSGFRRQGGSCPQPAPDITPELADIVIGGSEFKCQTCDFSSKEQNVLRDHISKVHKQCDLCPDYFLSVLALRDHIKLKHNKDNGTFRNCNKCHYSAVNRSHLKAHIESHHKKEKAQTINKINKTCKYWRDSSCNFGQNCKFKHEFIMCTFKERCRDILNCRFEHEKPGTVKRSVQNIVNPWSISAAPPANDIQNFPFLGQRQPWHKHQGGGLATLVRKELNPVFVSEGNDQEEIIVVECNIQNVAIRIINCYGPQENADNEKKQLFWSRLKNEVNNALEDNGN